MKAQALFLVFILCLTVGLQQSYQVFREHYSDSHDLEKEIGSLNEKSQRQALQAALLQNQVDDLQANVYATLEKKGEHLAWNERQWMKSLRGPASVPLIDSKSAQLLIEAKDLFRAQKYPSATENLRKLISDYPVSKDIVEAHFLLAEALFVQGQLDASLDVIDQMMTRYPDSEMTGFIMLRMGQILEARKRSSDAKEVYRTVLREFPHSFELKQQAESLLKGVVLS
jgi:TolA-binding protein